MTEDEFRKAVYYAVRETFNAERSGGDPNHIDLRWDDLIRKAIKFFEDHINAGKQFPFELRGIELIDLGAAAGRRRKKMTQITCQRFYDEFVKKEEPAIQMLFYKQFEKWDGRKWDWSGTYDLDVLKTLLAHAKERRRVTT